MDNYLQKIYFYEARSAGFENIIPPQSGVCYRHTVPWNTHNNREAVVVRGPHVAKHPIKRIALVLL